MGRHKVDQLVQLHLAREDSVSALLLVAVFDKECGPLLHSVVAGQVRRHARLDIDEGEAQPISKSGRKRLVDGRHFLLGGEQVYLLYVTLCAELDCILFGHQALGVIRYVVCYPSLDVWVRYLVRCEWNDLHRHRLARVGVNPHLRRLVQCKVWLELIAFIAKMVQVEFRVGFLMVYSTVYRISVDIATVEFLQHF